MGLWPMTRSRSRAESSYGGQPLRFSDEYALNDEPLRDAEHIPLRLTTQERKLQRLMRGVILASRYTDKVDSAAALKRNRDMLIVKELTGALTGLIVGMDLRNAATLLREREFAPYAQSICSAVETCRRYKIMNPDLLRTDYVKFLYMIQDAVQNDNARDALGFSLASELVTVGRYCRALGVGEMLRDARMPLCITPVPLLRNRHTLNKCLRCKDVTVDAVVAQYAQQHGVRAEAVEVVVRSLNDANCFANDNVKTTEQLLALLRGYFDPDTHTPQTSLAIAEGCDGSRLTHSHRRQYTFVLQSLTLWKNICRQMYALWTIAEEDMLNPSEKYELRETGQGLQRVQRAPRLYAAVVAVLQQTKEELGQWVGSERIHLGDDQVPNAFHFIDKYGQVARILIPILRTIDHIPRLVEDDAHKAAYVARVWGDCEGARCAILRDFFRHGFDGSGGDNMEDAGSCIDGRLTSAWNWCNTIRTKPFYPLFLFAGFSSFDGDMSM